MPIDSTGDGGIPNLRWWEWLNIQHLTLNRWDQQQFICHMYLQPRGRGHCMPFSAVRNRVNNQGQWHAGFVVTRGSDAPWFLQESAIGLFEYFHGLAVNWNLPLRNNQELHLVHLEGLCGQGTLSVWTEWEGALAVRLFEVLPIVPDVKAAHNIKP